MENSKFLNSSYGRLVIATTGGESRKGVFHCFSVNSIETENGVLQYPVAIIEIDKSVGMFDIDCFYFTDEEKTEKLLSVKSENGEFYIYFDSVEREFCGAVLSNGEIISTVFIASEEEAKHYTMNGLLRTGIVGLITSIKPDAESLKIAKEIFAKI